MTMTRGAMTAPLRGGARFRLRWRGLASLSLLPLLALLAASASAQSLLPLEDYSVIIERKPFGELGKPRGASSAEAEQAAAAEAQAEQAQQALAQQIDLVAVNITLRGTVSVGLVDKSVKPARSIYLGVGESDSGYTVESADYAAETATISKNGVKVTLKLGSGLVASGADDQGGGASEGAPATAPATAAAGDASGAPVRRMPTRAIRTPGVGGYRNRLLDRRRAEDAAVEAAENRRIEQDVERLRHASDSAAAKREHDLNYKLLLEGKEPVSEIHLTPEEEAELESKGILPPQE